MSRSKTIDWNATLYDDESVKEKLKWMTKWDAMIDDSRNPEVNIVEQVEDFLQLGKSYKITLKVDEIK